MKPIHVLWLANVPIPQAAEQFNLPGSYAGGWLAGLMEEVLCREEITLCYCFFSRDVVKTKQVTNKNVLYVALPMYSNLQQCEFSLVGVVREFRPEVIHLFGSEYMHSYAMALVAQQTGLIHRTILHIQGLVSVYAQHFYAGIPPKWIYRLRPRDLLRNSSVASLKHEFEKKGEYEQRLLAMLHHVGGRTAWDRACAYHANATIQYHHCGEILRPSFYKSCWSLDKCKRHTLFVSQGSSPVKGLHYVLEAMPLILKQYPNAKLIVGGEASGNLSDNLIINFKRPTYGAYLVSLIKRHHLESHVHFSGPLCEEAMRDQYLNSHVFVSASTIENSPNSLGEAMILGMPCVSSFVGGIPDMLEDKREGFLYQPDAPYMLAYYVMQLFSNDALATQMGQRARKRAMLTHDPEKITERVLEIYSLLAMNAETENE